MTLFTRTGFWLFFAAFLCSMPAVAQDSLHTSEHLSVDVRAFVLLRTPLTEIVFPRRELDIVQPEDLGQVLLYIPGVQVKSYGGLGGFKTLSVRSLGGQHTALTIDGFSIFDTQTGQVNLGLIQTDNLQRVAFSIGHSADRLQPVSAQMSGSVLALSSFENQFGSFANEFRYTGRAGSFGQFDNYLAFKHTRKKMYLSGFGKYRFANGQYPYSFSNGYGNYSGVRGNNDFRDGYAGLSAGFRTGSHSTLRFTGRYHSSDQGLPGAVIIYNDGAGQRLATSGYRFNGDFRFERSGFSLRAYAQTSLDDMTYTDPDYFNQSGGLRNQYHNRLLQSGISVVKNIRYTHSVYGGIETRLADLQTNIVNFADPLRFHFFGMGGYAFSRGRFQSDVQLSTQYVSNWEQVSQTTREYRVLNPYISAGFESLLHNHLRVTAWYRNSFRMPSFNELYYNNVGNKELLPERAHQLALSADYTLRPAKEILLLKVNAFFNRVENQILAIPTKNLFVWSMQNIGRTNTFGIESSLSSNLRFGKAFSLNQVLNYTFQHTVDISDPDSPSFRDQVAYIPKHTASWQLTFGYRRYGLRLTTYYSSVRYSLNENTAANRVPGFVTLDAGLFNTFEIGDKHKLRVQFTAKNLLNQSYAFVRYFVMPGRNYLLTLSYAFH